jgi:putative membrane protein
MLGVYDYLLGAVNDRNVLPVAVAGLGAVLGLASFSVGLNWLLRHHRDTVMAALIGLMIGSLRVIWPWPDGTETTKVALPDSPVALFHILLAAVAALAAFGVSWVSRRAVRSLKV